MKLSSLQISNVLGARAVDLKLTKPVALIAGKNYAGKSSVQEAIRHALTGETVRVSLKKDYAALISEGQESGFVEVGTVDVAYSVVLPSGKGAHCDKAALPYVLDAQRFAKLPDNERRQFLFGLMNVKLDGPAVKQRLLDKGCVAAKVDQVLPILRAGFDAATKEAAGKARDAKASWKTTTSGETWGKEKSGKWQPAALPEGAAHAADDLALTNLHLAEISAELGAAQQALGAANASQRQVAEAHAKRAGLEAIAAHEASHQRTLDTALAGLAEWEQKVADCKAKAGVAQPNPKAPGEFLLRGLASVTQDFLGLTERHPEMDWDTGLLTRASKHLYEFIQLHGEPNGEASKPDQEAVEKLPEYENALRLMQSAVANGKRNLEAAQIAATQLKALDELKVSAVDASDAEARVGELQAKRTAAQAEIDRLKAVVDQATRRASIVLKASSLHHDVLDWAAIADALAPDGIPAELLAEALGPINRRLAQSGNDAQWKRINIGSDMSIFAAEEGESPRPYNLLSESEKWRADAMIAEAVSHISGIKLLVLDRFDVLDGQGREDALYWLDDLAAAGEIDSCLLFGTLKSIPAQLPYNIEGFWIENGVAGAMKEAA